jgi:hypothetical protein
MKEKIKEKKQIKNCHTCFYTNPKFFDGSCPAAGEISGAFCNKEHKECWKEPK